MVPMVDLKKQFLSIQTDILRMMTEILESSHYVLGEKVKELEKRIADYHGSSAGIGVASGTDALHLALDAFGIGPGDEVVTTPFSFFATVEAILYTGATPVFVDIDPDTMNMDTGQIEASITEKTKALLPVHLFGHPADMQKIMKIAKKHRLRVIEDCAQSFGAEAGRVRTGAIGDAGCFSFYPSKNLGAYGDGGMIILDNVRVAAKIRQLRNHGSGGAYRHQRVGYNSRLDELQAGVLLIKFARIDEYNEGRRRNAAVYNSLLGDAVLCPVEREGFRHVYHQYTIRSRRRDLIQKKLKEKNISSVVYYPVPLHLQEALRFLGYGRGDFPVTERTAREVLSLPMFPELKEETIVRIAGAVKEAC
jgi:UDP-2-acetamido-2-deoxy-ribo-hexuluronate aminotransferase